MRLCTEFVVAGDETKFDDIRDTCLVQIREEEALAAKEKRERPARALAAAKDKAGDIAHGLKSKATHVGDELKQEAKEGVKEGVKGGIRGAFGF